MGIKDLWSIILPYCERKPLYELQGKRVAIDLSGWVCQAQCIADYQVQPKMYLRNLYFRTCFLVLHDVQAVFVLEGKAPKLKHRTIAARNEMQFKGAAPRSEKTQRKDTEMKGRTRFDGVLRQCKEMLNLMGLACITGEGEAEAMCAHLNKLKIVEGCISQDSDCFAYGANVVYRNFSISMQGNQACSGGSIDVYDLNISKREMDFGRNKIIALALLCGSDYNRGVFGIGKESALKFFSTLSDEEALKEIRAWRSNETHYNKLNGLVNDVTKCATCSHSGKKAAHTRNGCRACGTNKGCTINEEHANVRLALQLRSKALQDDAFPDEELLQEFLGERERVDANELNFQWEMPQLPQFIDFTRRHLQWEEVYAYEKLFPLLTRWIVHNSSRKPKTSIITSPEYIKKKRVAKGIPCYEIVWNKDKLLPLIPPEQVVTEHDKLFASIEPQALVDCAFPELVQQFIDSRTKPTKNKRAKKDAKTKTGGTIKSYVQVTKKANESNKSNDDSLFDDVDDDCDGDLSLIVEEICNRGVPEVFKRKINQLYEEERRLEGESSFFDFNLNEDAADPFEMSLFVDRDGSTDDDDEDA